MHGENIKIVWTVLAKIFNSKKSLVCFGLQGYFQEKYWEISSASRKVCMYIRSLTVHNTQWPQVTDEIIEKLFYFVHIRALGSLYQNKHRQCVRI